MVRLVRSSLLFVILIACFMPARPVEAGNSPWRQQPKQAAGVDLDKTYVDPAGFFSLDTPSAWETRPARSEVQFLADKQGNAGIAVSIQIKSVSAGELADSMAELLAGKQEGQKETGREESEIDGYPSWQVNYTYKQKNAAKKVVAMQGFLVAVVRNRVGFIIVGWASQASYAELKPIFERMVGSFSIARFDAAPDYDTWKSYKTDHFIFRYLPNTYTAKNIKAIARDHEKAYASILDRLEVAAVDPIAFFLYPSKEALYRSTARYDGHANTAAGEVHALWISAKDHQSLGHEMTHVITAQAIGEPAEALLGEGTAVCLDNSGNDLAAMARTYYAAGTLLPLAKLTGDAWFKQDADIAYRESGAFACYLLDEFGAGDFKRVYVATDMQSAMQETYGASLKSLEKRWLETLLD